MRTAEVQEEWKSVVGYEGRYEVSSKGRIRSVDRFVHDRIGRNRLLRGQIMKAHKSTTGYFAIRLSKQESHRDFRRLTRIHQLVARAFLGAQNGKEVNHRNGIKTDNRLENLEWVSHSQNGRHAWANGLNKGGSKQIMRSDGKIFESLAAAARSMNGNPAAVCHVLRGRLQTHKGYGFVYLDGKSC